MLPHPPTPSPHVRSTRLLRAWVAACLAACAWLTGEAAHGHGNDAYGVAPIYGGEGEVIGAVTSLGVVRRDADKLRLFDDLPARALWGAAAADGAVWIGGPSGVWRTDDWGCAWHAPNPALANVDAVAMARDPHTRRPLLIATSGAASASALWRSEDGGLTWSEHVPMDDGWRLTSLVAHPDGGFVAVSVSHDGQARLHLGDAAGMTWQTVEVDPQVRGIARVMIPDAEHDQVILAALAPDTTDDAPALAGLEDDAPVDAQTLDPVGRAEALWRVDRASGAAAQLGVTPEGVVWSHAAPDGEGAWVWVSTDDVVFAWDGEAMTETAETFRACAQTHPWDGSAWLCGERPFPYMFYSRDGAGAWQGQLAFTDAVWASCPSDDASDTNDADDADAEPQAGDGASPQLTSLSEGCAVARGMTHRGPRGPLTLTSGALCVAILCGLAGASALRRSTARAWRA